jgi:hypothetical protein
MPHKNLIISAVGDESVHRTWLAQEHERRFDVCLIYFGSHPGRFQEDAKYYFPRRGVKYRLVSDLAQLHPEILSRYERIWCPDDDIAVDTRGINRFFELMEQHSLEVAQPGVEQGDAAFRALRRHPEYTLRYTRYVEVMCPAFTRGAFERVLPTFTENMSAWGIDCVWSSMFAEQQMAVIDAVGVAHTRPLQSGGVHKLLVAQGIDPQAEYDAMIKKYGLKIRRFQRSMVFDSARLRGVDLAGNRVWTRPWWSIVWPGERRIRGRACAATKSETGRLAAA